MRVNSSLAQFHIANANTPNNVVIKNVDFKYTAADFNTCLNSAWKGSYTQAQAPTAQIYLLNNGNVTELNVVPRSNSSVYVIIYINHLSILTN